MNELKSTAGMLADTSETNVKATAEDIEFEIKQGFQSVQDEATQEEPVQSLAEDEATEPEGDIQDPLNLYPEDVRNFLTDLKDKTTKEGTPWKRTYKGFIETSANGLVATDPICFLSGVEGIAWWEHNDKLALSAKSAASLAAAYDLYKGHDPLLRKLILEACGLVEGPDTFATEEDYLESDMKFHDTTKVEDVTEALVNDSLGG